jgi:glutamate 5-kinase
VSTRDAIASATRLVVKVGSSSLTAPDGGLDAGRLLALVNVLAARRHAGSAIVLVSSGAIAAGLAPLGLVRRPRDLATQQAAASVGQGALVAAYQHAFGAHGLTVGQVLLTADDVTRRTHYANARRTLERLLALGVVPVINENDTVATHEIRFGDNDRLAALVAHLVHAEALVLLSDVDALYDGPPSRPGSRRIPEVRGAADLVHVVVKGSASTVGTGGMSTKLEAAAIATQAGVTTLLTSAERSREGLAGDDVGTLFTPTGARRTSRLLWLAHATAPMGRLLIDDGAVRAVVQRRKSLLPAGITAVEGRFDEGDPVDVCAPDGRPVARGLVNFSSDDLPELLGRSTRDLARELGPQYEREVIHRDDLVLLGD